MPKTDTFESEQLTDAVYFILLSLVEVRHGYAIMQFISEATNNRVSMGPGTLYTLLKKLDKSEWIAQKDLTSDRKKQYQITPLGMDILIKELKRRQLMVQLGENILHEVGIEDV
ncbi:MAG: PadR family transcriptional regulator [Beduini sp.]